MQGVDQDAAAEAASNVVEVVIGKFTVRLSVDDGEETLQLHAVSPTGISKALQVDMQPV